MRALLFALVLCGCDNVCLQKDSVTIKALEGRVAALEREFQGMQKDTGKDADRMAECLAAATKDYWGYVELNGGKKDQATGLWTARHSVFDLADKQKQTAVSECRALYGN